MGMTCDYADEKAEAADEAAMPCAMMHEAK
jgi:hypothetical protein